MKISASDQVADWLCALPPQTKRRVRTALRALSKGKGDIKGLQGSLEGFNRLRIGGIRILFRQIFIVEDMCAAPWTATACCSSGPCSPAARPTALAREIPQNAAKPWLALRDGGTFIGDPFEPVVSESEIESPK